MRLVFTEVETSEVLSLFVAEVETSDGVGSYRCFCFAEVETSDVIGSSILDSQCWASKFCNKFNPKSKIVVFLPLTLK